MMRIGKAKRNKVSGHVTSLGFCFKNVSGYVGTLRTGHFRKCYNDVTRVSFISMATGVFRSRTSRGLKKRRSGSSSLEFCEGITELS